jgi:hypothetical protein
LDYEVEREFNGPWGGHNICIFFKSDIEYFETIMENAIDAMYYNYFSHMDDNSGEWAHEYLDMVNYIRNKYQDKIMKHYDDNCGPGLIPLKESIRKVLREEVNESTFFRRRVDMSLINKEFFENLNIITDVYLKKYNNGIDFNFETFENHLINYLMDNYHGELSNFGLNDDFPYDEVYEFLLNYFHNKIKDRYDTFFGNNINESVDKSEDKKLKLVKSIIYNMFDNVSLEYDSKANEIMVYHDKEEKLEISEICDTINDFTGLNVVPWFEYDKNRIGKEPDFYLDIEEYGE